MKEQPRLGEGQRSWLCEEKATEDSIRSSLKEQASDEKSRIDEEQAR